MHIHFFRRLFCLVLLLGATQMLSAQGTAFTYQGQLNVGGAPANNVFDLRFALYDAPTNGNAIGNPLTNGAVPVVNGLFTTNLDFGPVFTGANYWLSIGVRTNGDTNAFTLLWPRQALLPVPYAIFASSASNLVGSLYATQLVGTLPASAFAGYTNTVAFTNGANLFSGSYSGNGLNLTNLNGSAVTVGTVADARLSTNVAFLSANQTFGGSNNFNGPNLFTNWNNSFTGSFYGNGLVGWIVAAAASVPAAVDTGYILTSSTLTTVTLPTPLHVGDVVRLSGAGAGGWRIAPSSGVTMLGNFLSYDSGTWVASSAPSTFKWIALCSSASGNFLAAAPNDGNVIYYSTDGGLTWSSSGSNPASWHAIACSSTGSRVIAGVGSSTATGSLYYSTNSGVNWSTATGEPTALWTSMDMSANGSNAVAVAYGGGIYLSTNGGVNWSVSSMAPSTNWFSVACSASGSNIVAAATGGRIYTTSNFGASWTPQTGAPATNWYAVVSSADGRKLAADGLGGVGLYTSGDFGVTWTKQAVTNSLYCLSCSADGGKLVAGNSSGSLYASSDFGVTWSQQSAPSGGWAAIASSADGSKVAAAINGGSIYYSAPASQMGGTTNVSISGPQGSAVELQYIGNNQWMPVSSSGTLWGN